MSLSYPRALLGASITLITFTLSQNIWACASCGCSLSTDWGNQGVLNSGFSADLRYDYLNQDQLRHGTSTITPQGIYNLNQSAEVEDYTKNQYTTLTLGYMGESHWEVSLALPYINRQHQTWGQSVPGSGAASPTNPSAGYYSDFNELGDAKLMFTFRPLENDHRLGMTLGLKLPTGRHDLLQSYPAPFNAQSPAALVDPGLQPGTATTDVIVGISLSDALSRNWDYFGQVMYQTAVAGPTDNYHPGNSENLNLGLRYMGFETLIPQVQINARHVNTDSGAIADTLSTGGTLAYLSPGISIRAMDNVRLYAFAQLPIYQNLTGFQLAPRYTLSVGVHASF
jgi:hypothetical protein